MIACFYRAKSEAAVWKDKKPLRMYFKMGDVLFSELDSVV